MDKHMGWTKIRNWEPSHQLGLKKQIIITQKLYCHMHSVHFFFYMAANFIIILLIYHPGVELSGRADKKFPFGCGHVIKSVNKLLYEPKKIYPLIFAN